LLDTAKLLMTVPGVGYYSALFIVSEVEISPDSHHLSSYGYTSNIAQLYRRISKKKGNSNASVDAASKLLKSVYWIMKEKRMHGTLV